MSQPTSQRRVAGAPGTLAKRGSTPTTTIRLAADDIELAKKQAAERGLRYQTYLKMVIHQALRREMARS